MNEQGSVLPLLSLCVKQMIRKRQFYRIGNLIAALAFGMILLLLYLAEIRYVPDAGENGAIYLFGVRMPEACLYHRVLGRPCLGCGLTHGIVALLDGGFRRASEIHPSSVWVTAWFAAQVFLRFLLVFSPSRYFPTLLFDMGTSMVTMVICIYLPIVC